MLPFKTLIIIDESSTIAVYRQIADCLIVLMKDGIIQPGTFLPSTREMAVLLDKHRNTIVAAYEELSTQDWIETLPRVGIRVALDLPLIKPRLSMTMEKIKLIPALQNSVSGMIFLVLSSIFSH